MFNNGDRSKKSDGFLNLDKFRELGLPSTFFKNARRLLCPICLANFSLRGIMEHIAEKHLPQQCLQIAHCNNHKCKKKRNIFSVNFLTDHFMDESCVHELIYPRKKCRHRVNCQVAADAIMEISIYLGFVDNKGDCIDPAYEDRVRAFKSKSASISQRDFFFTHAHIDNKHKVACFVAEDRDDRERNGAFIPVTTAGEYQSYERSPAYGRSPAASPGPGSGRCTPVGGRSPSGYRSPPGGRSPGGAAGYDEPERLRPRSFKRPSHNSDVPKTQNASSNLSTHNDGTSRSGKRSNELRLAGIKEEVMESTPVDPFSQAVHSSPPVKRNMVQTSTYNAPAASTIPFPPPNSQLGGSGNGIASFNQPSYPQQYGMVPNGNYYPFSHMDIPPASRIPNQQATHMAQYGSGYQHVMQPPGTSSHRSWDAVNRRSPTASYSDRHHSRSSSGTSNPHNSRRQGEQSSSHGFSDRRSYDHQAVPRHEYNTGHNTAHSSRPPAPKIDQLLAALGSGEKNKDTRWK